MRRTLAALLTRALLGAALASPIDRRALVERHNVRLRAIETDSPLTVGNGEFATTVDVTGLQTLNASYLTFPPLQTMSHWAWHRVPAKVAGVNPRRYEYEQVVGADGHTSLYATNTTPTPEYSYLRANPHRVNLGRIFLRRLWPLGGGGGGGGGGAAPAPIQPADLTDIDQTLFPFNGTIVSNFGLDGQLVSVTTAVHPELDVLAVRVCSSLVANGTLGVGVGLPYPTEAFAGGTDWQQPGRHRSATVAGRPETLLHTLDNTSYYVQVASAGGGGGARFQKGYAAHDWIVVAGPPPISASSQCLSITLWFTRTRPPPSQQQQQQQQQRRHRPGPGSAEAVFKASASAWAQKWQSGAAVDFSGSSAAVAADAAELERRVVLSQYIMMSQEAGSNPPQETGLMTNSWYGKFHLEMRWHHSFHFFLWGREKLAQRAEQYFADVRDPARAFTRDKQGYAGVRWPKMVAPPEFMTWTGLPSPQGQEEDHEDEEEEEGGATSSGDDDDDNTFFWYDGPSGAGPWILWQQPHPISFAEMAYRNAPTAGTVARYNRTVHDSADFMADFILRNNAIDNFQRDGDGSGGRGGEQAACYSLGPPMFTAEIESFEGKPATAAKDGTFENVYWHFGLTVANNWRARLQLPPEPRWVEAVEKLCAPVPRALNMTGPRIYYPYSGVGFTEAFAPGYAVQLFANALVPGAAHGLDDAVTAETLKQALVALDIDRLPWCSDPPLYAMAAARLGQPDQALAFLLQPHNNFTGGTMRYLSSGHCQIKGFLPVYTPGNGVLLSAVAMLAGGWDGDGGGEAPGFPRDAGWSVRAEGFSKMF